MNIPQNDSLYNLGGGTPVNKMMSGFSPAVLTEWMATAGGNSRTAQYGYFGPGSLLRKDISSAGDTMIGADFFVNTFGAKVWDSLNSQTRAFNILRKVAWGNTTGWRIRSGRNMSTRGVGEIAALPSIDTPDLQMVHVQPSFVVTAMGVSALAQFLSTLEGGLGDALAVAQESAEVDHLKAINRMVVAPAELRVVSVKSGDLEITVPDGAGDYVSPGDTFQHSSAGGVITVTAIDGDKLTVTQTGTAVTAGELLFTNSRGGLWSLIDIVNEDKRNVNGVQLDAGEGAAYGNLGGTTTGRVAGSWNAAGYVGGNSGVIRHLTTGHLDKAIEKIRINGFQPDVILTGVEQETRLGTLLQANQHFMGQENFTVKEGGEATLPGYQTGFQVATYKGIPVFTDADMARSYQLATDGHAARGPDALLLDTRYIEVPVLFTTQYMESRDYIHNNMLGIKAIFLTAANIRCLNFRAQARITDLSTGDVLA